MENIKDAFFQICNEARPMSNWYVSLYQIRTFYGGPEEGGWWGRDVILVAAQEFHRQDEAVAVMDKIEALAKSLTKEAEAAHSRQCRSEMEWLEARGLDADFLPEVGGPDKYFIHLDQRPDSEEMFGDRHYS